VVNLNQKEIGFGFARYLFEALDLGRLASKNAQPLITASLVTNALISHAVTKGLDDDAEMKDSGVEWLGEIPAGWGTAKLKHVCTQIKDGLHHTPSKVPENDGVPFISTQHVRHREVNIGDATYIAREDYEAGHPSVAPEPGDVLITLVGSIGFAAILPDEMYPISATRHVGYVRPGDKLSAEYLCHYTESTAFKRFLGLETSQVAQPSIYLTSLANHTVPLPPLDEQREIAGRLNDILKRFDTLTTRVRDGIDRLKEYRTALISAAVTGQIDVREEAEMYK
jgi:type I restriction enzyme S subunit